VERQMFERYSEKARRVIFFSRYEASQFGSPKIDTEHLLLGLIREDKALYRWLPRTDLQTIPPEGRGSFNKTPADIDRRRFTA
jgi:Clp amino terminal domain, pathogenicity island component